jgi:hypothetical protein
MPKYYFSIGNSTSGPVEFCALVEAAMPEEAVDRLKRVLPDELTADDRWGDKTSSNEYICVYLNADAITTDDIDFVED